MKITVNRQLSGGTYFVSFKVGEFTAEEITKLQKFGVPKVPIMMGTPPTLNWTPLNQISEKLLAGFKTEQEALNYQEQILEFVRKGMKELRDKQDQFSSSTEVEV